MKNISVNEINQFDQKGYLVKKNFFKKSFINQISKEINLLKSKDLKKKVDRYFGMSVGKNRQSILVRIENFYRTIFIILAKISNSQDMAHKIGPFTFFPLKKFIILGDDKKVELTEKEVDILKCLISSGEEVVDRDKLLKQVWNYSSDVTTHTLETHIYRLRQKLEIYPSIPRLIISQGGGFRILQF